jgi:hypothetical protein
MLVHIPIDALEVKGTLEIPSYPLGLLLYAHRSGSSRLRVSNHHVAVFPRQAGLGTLLIDLLTARDDSRYQPRLYIDLPTCRLDHAAAWLIAQDFASGLRLAFSMQASGQLHRFGLPPGAQATLPPWCHAAAGQILPARTLLLLYGRHAC